MFFGNFLKNSHVISAKLSGFENHYKIKLRAKGYRLVYEVVDKELIAVVIAVGKREKNLVYKNTQNMAAELRTVFRRRE